MPPRGASGRALVIALAVAAGARASAPPGAGAGEEWTLDAARDCWLAMVRPVQHVGVPGWQFQTGVMWDGALVFGPLAFRELKAMQAELAPLGETRLHVSFGFGDPMRFPDRKGTGNPAIRRSLLGGRLPIPIVLTEDGDLRWTETVFAHIPGRSIEEASAPPDDDMLVTHALFSVRNAGPGPRAARLSIHFGDTSSVQLGYKCVQKDALAPAIAHERRGDLGWVGDAVRYVLPAPAKGKIGVAGGLLRWDVSLAAGEAAELRLILPYGPVDRAAGERLAALDSAKLLEATAASWRALIGGPGRIVTPDAFVNDCLAAAAGQMAQQVAWRARSRGWMYKTSPNNYEGYWPCNAAKAMPAFDLRGLSRLSGPVLGAFIDARTDDVRGMDRGVMGRNEGLAGEGFARVPGFMGNFGEWTANPLLLSHGLGMWALAAHYRIGRDEEWLRKGALDALLGGFDWISTQRRRTMREEDGKKVAHWGLLPAASAHDWLAGNTVFNDAFCIYGMAETVRLLREIGHPRAEEMARELADYRKTLRDRYAEARDRARRVPLEGGASIPYVPRMVQELDWAKLDWTYSGYSVTRAGAWGAIDPHDELVDQALAFLEAGMPKGDGAYFSAPAAALQDAGGRRPPADANWADISDPAASRHWMWRHYVEYETMWPVGGPLFLERDDLPRFFEWLFHNLAVAVHRDWRVGVESLDGVPSCAPGEGERWQCIRAMFVGERGGYDGSRQDLWLLQAIPRCWLRPGMRSSVREMGTSFGGRIDLDVECAAGGDAVTVRASWRGLAVEPRTVKMRLRSGDGRPLASAEVDGKGVLVLPGDTIELPAATAGDFTVLGRF